MAGDVEDLITQLEDCLGNENLYRLIYAGKLLKEEKPISYYNINSKIPIIVMVTKQSYDKDTQTNMQRRLSNSKVADIDNYTAFKRQRTDTEDSGFEEDLNSEHFVTDTEFDNVLEIILKCEYLSKESETEITQ